MTVGYNIVANPGSIKDHGTVEVTAGIDSFNLDAVLTLDAQNRLTCNVKTMKGDVGKLDYDLSSHSWVIRMAEAAAHGTIVSSLT